MPNFRAVNLWKGQQRENVLINMCWAGKKNESSLTSKNKPGIFEKTLWDIVV